MPESNLTDVIYRWRVRSGSVGILLAIILSRPTLWSLIGGSAITLFSILVRTWACGYLKKEKELTISGPYRYTRNPLYFGNFILGVGIVLGSRSLWMLGIFTAYFLFFYPVVIKRETEKMKDFFPQEYQEFKNKVPPFFPALKSSSAANSNHFSWERYRKNKEYRALIGAIVFWLILTLKFILL